MMLKRIIERKTEDIKEIREYKVQPSDRSFRACIKGRHNIIAEIKRKSPSAGVLREEINLKEIAAAYDRYANAISVVTDRHFFGGNAGDIKAIKENTRLPVLRKDFIIDKRQIFESRHYGADAILLIAALLDNGQINDFIDEADKLNMDCLVEVHSKEELENVLKTKAEIIGINNRNLNDFKTDIKITNELAEIIPKDRLVVSESGFDNIGQIKETRTNAVLIGSSLMTAENISDKLRSLRTTKVKICGITSYNDAISAINAGADFIGFNFYKDSPRYIEPEKARKIIERLPNTAASVGVFVNEDINKVKEAEDFIDMIQLHGDESYAELLNKPVIKAFRVEDRLPEIKDSYFACLFDTFHEGLYGGTGKTFNTGIIKGFEGKLFLSGGLDKHNVRELELDPYCIDVCSGVEKSKGVKDNELVKEFVEVIKNA